MMTPLVLASLLALGPATAELPCTDPVGPVTDDALRELYEAGRPYGDFLDRAERRAELWHGNTAKAEDIDMELVRRARAVGGTWRFLAVAIDSCSDSVSTIPYLARLVELVDGLDLRVVDPTAGRAVMEGHPTPDGRAATPTVLLLDERWEEAGCFIERPPTVRDWILDRQELSGDEIFEWKMAWYAEDAGQETVESFVAMLEAAAAGERICA